MSVGKKSKAAGNRRTGHETESQTRRKALLEEAEENLQTLLHRIGDCLFILDPQGTIIRANALVTARLGYAEQELRGAPFIRVHPPDRADEVIAHISAVLAGKSAPCNVPLLAKDGTLLPVESRVTRGQWDGHDALLCVSREINEQVQAEPQMRTQRDLAVKLSATTELREGLRLCLEAALHASGMDSGGVYLVDEQTGDLDLAFYTGRLRSQFIENTTHFAADSAPVRLVMAGEPVYIPLWELDLPVNADMEREGIRASAIIPVHYHDRVIGCVNLASHEIDELPPSARDAVETIVAQMGGAIVRLRAERDLGRRVRELEALEQTVLEIAAPHELPMLLQTIVERAALLLDTAGGALYLCDPEREEVRCVVSYNTTHDYKGLVLKYGEGAAGMVARTGQPLIIDDYYTWEGRATLDAKGAPFVGILSVPMIWQGQVSGVIHLIHHDEERRFSRAEMDLLTLLANHAALAVANAHLFEEARNELAQRRQAEEALQRSEERFRALIENSLDLISIVDANGIIRYVSPSAEQALGYRPAELVGSSALELVHPDDVAVAAAALANLEAGGSMAREGRLRHRDGSWRTYESTGTNLVHHPAIGGIVVNSRDLTERKALEEQLHASQRMEALERMAGGMCHDFNNLLTVITGTTSVLLADLADDDLIRQDVLSIQQAARLAAESTRQLLAFSSKQIVKPSVLNLTEFISARRHILRHYIGQHIVTTLILQPDLGLILVDPGGLEQMIFDLVAQSCESMPQGGELIIETRNIYLTEIDTAAHPEVAPGNYVTLTVSDTGPGMANGIAKRIFEPFFLTLDRGPGLRLAAAYGFVRQSGGHITVRSGIGRGTAYTVYLPEATK